MDAQTLTDILDRAENGETTDDDIPVLHRLMGTRHYLPGRARAFVQHLRQGIESDPDALETLDAGPSEQARPMEGRLEYDSPREGSAVTILLTFSCDRFPRGEIVIRNHYRLDGGTVERDRSRRVYSQEQPRYFIEELWALLFEHIAAADQYHPSSILIRLQIPHRIGPVYRYTRAVAEVAATEFGALVAGTAPDLAHAS